jgi:hypothetical protein
LGVRYRDLGRIHTGLDVLRVCEASVSLGAMWYDWVQKTFRCEDPEVSRDNPGQRRGDPVRYERLVTAGPEVPLEAANGHVEPCLKASYQGLDTSGSSAEGTCPNSERELPWRDASWRHNPAHLWTSHGDGVDRRSWILSPEDSRAMWATATCSIQHEAEPKHQRSRGYGGIYDRRSGQFRKEERWLWAKSVCHGIGTGDVSTRNEG